MCREDRVDCSTVGVTVYLLLMGVRACPFGIALNDLIDESEGPVWSPSSWVTWSVGS